MTSVYERQSSIAPNRMYYNTVRAVQRHYNMEPFDSVYIRIDDDNHMYYSGVGQRRYTSKITGKHNDCLFKINIKPKIIKSQQEIWS